ncbi:hypothetical protein QWY99_22185 [Flavobacterium branchiarum]|uniref:hypothetical protein n=1 Tax=Flavobacterium branchiarum TaxID=1114870 RepID=UPI0025B4B626|nr:hypothetical protein [Flavobacterium branchiarum]MDN3671514.1 hypothetical protein [Flavobacterium branchiarum]MDN3672609.1 hypothetical protein [Flavobacterium branchiarum]MDN3675747.1 hypothetical protein [Flavobacterium branchiarum]
MTDFLLDDDFDLLVTDGDLVVGESTAQHQKMLILIEKGELKDVPMRGVGAQRYLEDDSPENLAREIRLEFSFDGMTVNKIQIASDLTIEIDAKY